LHLLNTYKKHRSAYSSNIHFMLEFCAFKNITFSSKYAIFTCIKIFILSNKLRSFNIKISHQNHIIFQHLNLVFMNQSKSILKITFYINIWLVIFICNLDSCNKYKRTVCSPHHVRLWIHIILSHFYCYRVLFQSDMVIQLR